MGAEPRSAWRLKDGTVEDWTAARGWHNPRKPADPLADLALLVDAARPADVPEVGQFWGGAVGFFSYDMVRIIEKLPARTKPSLGAPDALFVFTRSLVILDNLHGRARVVISVPIPHGAGESELEALYAAASGELDEILARLRAPVSLPAMTEPSAPRRVSEHSSYERSRFSEHVERIREYILAGECFQVLLSGRIDVPLDVHPAALYRALRAVNPSPDMFHLVLDGLEIVGSSRELLVRVAAGRVTLLPIPGTRRRSATPAGDAQMSEQLLADAKGR